MPITITPVRPEHVATLGQICFEAFGTLHARHGVERDFDTVEAATMVIGMLASRPDFAGFAAIDSGTSQLLGSNFLGFSDPVAGVGPITIRPEAQAHGVGRLLMLAVMDEARRRSITQVRLQQEALNTTSLSLYTKLGFQWREAVSLVRTAAERADHPQARPLAERDLGAVDEISQRHYHNTRVNEVAMFLKAGFPAFGLERAGRLVAYHVPGFFGHGFAASAADLADLITHATRQVPPMFHKVLVPPGEHDLHCELLSRNCRSIKLFNYMTTGPYTRPSGAWVPSIGM